METHPYLLARSFSDLQRSPMLLYAAENRTRVAQISHRLISSTLVRKELQLPPGFELVQPNRQVIRGSRQTSSSFLCLCLFLFCFVSLPLPFLLTPSTSKYRSPTQVLKEGHLEDVRWKEGELKHRTFFLFNDCFIKGQFSEGEGAPCAYRGLLWIGPNSMICRGEIKINRKRRACLSVSGEGEGDSDEWT